MPLISIKTQTFLSQHLPSSRFLQLIHTQKQIIIILKSFADGYSLRHGLYLLPQGGAYSLVSQIGLPQNDRSLKYIPSSSRKLKKEITYSEGIDTVLYNLYIQSESWRNLENHAPSSLHQFVTESDRKYVYGGVGGGGGIAVTRVRSKQRRKCIVLQVLHALLWIRIRKDPHHFGNLDPHPDPHPHQIKIRIRIKIYKLYPEPDPNQHQFADVKPKCMEYEHFLQGLSLFCS